VRHRYPNTQQHNKEHEYLIVKVQAYDDNYKIGTAVMSIDVVDFKLTMLCMHNMDTTFDKDPVLYISLRGDRYHRNDKNGCLIQVTQIRQRGHRPEGDRNPFPPCKISRDTEFDKVIDHILNQTKVIEDRSHRSEIIGSSYKCNDPMGYWKGE
jgi:hypothetical protein